jgi:hypothetical protein
MPINVTRARLRAAFVFLAFTTPLGIAAHLISELAGLGWHDDADVAFSARHAYLAVLAAMALAGLLLALHRVPGSERRARVAEIVENLPFRGRGLRFAAFSFVAQFGFFALTQAGEGCPLCGGDVLVGVVAAAVAALLGAFAISLGQRRLLDFVLALVDFIVAASLESGAARVIGASNVPRARATRRSAFAFRYRPPPRIAVRPAA